MSELQKWVEMEFLRSMTLEEINKVLTELNDQIKQLQSEITGIERRGSIDKIVMRRDFKKVQRLMIKMAKLYTEGDPVVTSDHEIREAIEAAKEVDWQLMLPHQQKEFEPIRYKQENPPEGNT